MNAEMETAVAKALVLLKRAGLAAAPAEIDTETVEIWTLVLANAGLTPADVRQATAIVAGRDTFWPQPVKFIEAIRPPLNEDLAADRAWLAVRACVQRLGHCASLTPADLGGDAQALWAVDRIGWQRLCESLTDDKERIWRAAFVGFYRVARDEGAVLAYLPGYVERDNRFRGQALTPARCGRPDWNALPASTPALSERAELAPVGAPRIEAGRLQSLRAAVKVAGAGFAGGADEDGEDQEGESDDPGDEE